jgi:hypothetical protein
MIKLIPKTCPKLYKDLVSPVCALFLFAELENIVTNILSIVVLIYFIGSSFPLHLRLL